MSSIDRFWVMSCLAFISVAFGLGGSPRPEVETLPLLRGTAVFFGALALEGLTRRKLCATRLLLALAFAFLLVLPFAQLLPLPPGFAASLDGHGVVGEIDRIVGPGLPSRPLTMSPLGTANALLAATVPLTALLIGLNVPHVHHKEIIRGVVGLGLVSVCFGLAQIMAPQDSALYFFETTNRGSPVGLFANRNHHAVFLACLIVLLPIALPLDREGQLPGASDKSAWFRSALLILACLWVAGMALLTGSRSGALATSVALIMVPLILRSQATVAEQANPMKRLPKGFPRSLVLMFTLATIIPFAMWIDRAPALDRLFDSEFETEARLKILPQVVELTWLYWPWGSGVGSFEKVYQIHEPHELLAPYYMNHAHNDVLEVIMTAGVAGLGILICAFALWLYLAFQAFVLDRPDPIQPLRKAGVVIICLLSLASLTDYPLRTPSLAVLFAFAWLWASAPYRPSLTR